MRKYDPHTDQQFQSPFIDIEEIREDNVAYRYVHGGFSGTDTRFSFFFPVRKEDYRGRFFHFLAPMQGSEDASVGRAGIEDKIKFAISNGAYFVETNMGVGVIFGSLPDPTIIYRASASSAEYSREVARRLYGEHRAYGYIYGGSGGGYKSISCFENTDVWDGACPYVIGSPVCIPNMFTVRALAKRVLRHKLPQIADAADAGGGDMYQGLSEEEHRVLEEATKMGFPPKVWFQYQTLDDGALPVLTPAVAAMDGSYYHDFWNLPGYEGADAKGSVGQDRIRHRATIEEIYLPEEIAITLPFEKEARHIPRPSGETGVDESWKRLSSAKLAGWTGQTDKPALRLSAIPKGDLYLCGTQIKFTGGEIAGYAVPLERLEGNWVIVGEGFGLLDMLAQLSKLKVGDEVLLDNSDYIAMQYYHRHQVPEEYYEGFAQFVGADGRPIYPQRPVQIGPIVAAGGAGSLQSGAFNGKMINVCALMDESALPWNGDWYARKVAAHWGEQRKDHHRLWYIENALHDDSGRAADDLHLVRYLGALHQALLDVSDWVERGIPPAADTVYTVKNGQVSVPADAGARGGIQPTIQFTANGREKTTVQPGETVVLAAEIEFPSGSGRLTECKLAVAPDEPCYTRNLSASVAGENKMLIRETLTFDRPGIYFPVLRIKAQRNGIADDLFTQIENLKRVRVIVQ